MNKKIFKIIFLLTIILCNSKINAKNYTINVGQYLNLEVPSVSLGYVDKAIWGCTNPAISFISKSDFSATITALNAFSGYATIELIYIERYIDNKGHTRANTYRKNFYVSCIESPSGGESTITPTAIYCPPQIEVEIGQKAKIPYSFTPSNASAKIWHDSYPGTNFNGITIFSTENYLEGYARNAGTEEVDIYFYDNNDNKISTTCKVVVYDPTWITPQSISMQTSIVLKKGEIKKLLPQLTPTTATTLFTWTSDNNSVVIINGNHELVAKGNGTATVTVETTNGLICKCNILVIDSETQIPGISKAYQRAQEMLITIENEIVQ